MRPPEVFYKKRCSLKFHKIHRKTPVPCSFIKKRLWHRCFPENFAKFLRIPFLQNKKKKREKKKKKRKRRENLVYVTCSLLSLLLTSLKLPDEVQIKLFDFNFRKEKRLFVSI